MQPFIIFSLPRTGSTTLQRLLNCHSGIRCLFEPFNPTNLRRYAIEADTVRRSHGLAFTVQSLWTVCNGFKHVWQWDGFPFPDSHDLNRQLLLNMGARIIFVTRRNRLRRAISGQISGQMQVWTAVTEEDVRAIRAHRYGSLNIEELREDINRSRDADAWTRDQLRHAGVPWVEIVYEDFLETAAPLKRAWSAFNLSLEFLGVGRVSEPEPLAEMRRLFAPDVTGFQSAAHYREIPNIAEVERELGSGENGFVFD